MDGQVFDRHLLGLRILQSLEEGQDNVHPMFTDKAYQIANNFLLSTSNMPAQVYFPGFGPVAENGYGFCYTIRKTEVSAMVTSRFSSNETSSQRFQEEITRAFDDLRDMVESSKKQPKL